MSKYSSVEIDAEGIKKILNTEWLGIDSITSMEEEAAVADGENYGSVIRRIKLTGEKQGKPITRNVIMKKDRIMEDNIEFPFCKLEIQVYTEILPKLKELVDNLPKDKANVEIMWPICLGVRNYDVLLFEDLTVRGYTLRNRRIPMPPQVALVCIENLAKFHALSIVAVKRKLVDTEIIKTYMYTANIPVLNNVLGGGLSVLADNIQAHPQWSYIAPSLRKLADNVGLEIQKLGEKVKNVFPVINHGDCWSNNILFKFDENSSAPSSLRFVDFQVAHYSCFAWDIIYLMNTSMSGKDKQSCYKQMIETYRTCLVSVLETLEENDEETTQVPSLENIYSTLDKLNLFAMIISFSLFPLTVNVMEKPWDFEKVLNNDKVNAHLPEMYTNKTFVDSFEIDIVRFKSQGLF